MKPIIKLIIIACLVSACATTPVGDTSQNALDWPGTYQCEKMTIILRENNTYKAQIGDVEIRSSFHWDKNGRGICLENLKLKSACKKFLVGENMLIPLKNSGRPVKEGKPLFKVKGS